MPGPLPNGKHERFAHEMAKGALQKDAYRTAGFRGGENHASRLGARADVRARIAELLAGAAKRTEISIAGVTKRLLSIADKAEVDALGASGLAVARAALMDAAKLNGLVKDRHEMTGRNGGPIEYRDLSEEEVDARLDELAKRHGHAPLAH